MVWMFPMHSKVKSRPPSVISARTCWIGRSWSLGFTNSVTPNCLPVTKDKVLVLN